MRIEQQSTTSFLVDNLRRWSPSGGPPQPQFLHSRSKCAGLDSQQLGGSAAAVDFPARFVQHGQNVAALRLSLFVLRAYLNDIRIVQPL
jgi:hypothetical protein